jgi:hypothetical protein
VVRDFHGAALLLAGSLSSGLRLGLAALGRHGKRAAGAACVKEAEAAGPGACAVMSRARLFTCDQYSFCNYDHSLLSPFA